MKEGNARGMETLDWEDLVRAFPSLGYSMLREVSCTTAHRSADSIGQRKIRSMPMGARPVVDRISGPDPGHLFTMSNSGRHGTSPGFVEHFRNMPRVFC